MIQSSENTAIKTFFQNIIKVLPRVVQGGVLELLQHAPTCPSVPQRAPACPSMQWSKLPVHRHTRPNAHSADYIKWLLLELPFEVMLFYLL